MIRTELRKWDKYEKKSEWKEFINSLSKDDYSIYQSYRGFRGNIVKVENKMNKLNNQLKELKETQNEYYKKMTLVNSQIDHLRKEFNISPNVSYWKKSVRRDEKTMNVIVDKNEYFLGGIQRSGYKKIGLNLGNIKTVKQRLLDYYKGNSYQLNRIRKDSKDRKTYKDLVNGFISSNESKTIIRNEIRMNPKMKSLKKPLDVLFPLVKKKSKPKPKGVSIPIMITNQMRMSLSTLGYSKEEMKHLTPIESHEIINKGVPKKPSRERGRNQ